MDNPEYFVSINEVSKRLSVPAYTLRYWEKQFPTAIKPVTGAAGRRYYRMETVERLTVIRDLLYKNKITIAGVKKLIHDGKLPCPSSVFQPGADDTVVTSNVPSPIDINDTIDTAIDFLKTAKQLLDNQ